jgi:hypothetical protein
MMTTMSRHRRSGTFLSFAMAAAFCGSAAYAQVLTYTGSTPNWFAPSNWDGGRVPGPGDDVVIGGGRTVVIDPANDPAAGAGGGGGAGKVSVRDISITGDATLETLPGTEFITRNETINHGTLIHRSTRAFDTVGDLGTLLTTPCVSCGGIKLNPSPKSKRIIVLSSSVTVGLGGTTAASNLVPDAYGAGHYATLTTDDATLGGALDLDLFYGFTPSIGQTFQIINVGSTGGTSGVRTGQFDGLGEGAFVKGFGAIGLYISYAGGDGNDVVLTAGVIPEPAALSLLALSALIASRRRR